MHIILTRLVGKCVPSAVNLVSIEINKLYRIELYLMAFM